MEDNIQTIEKITIKMNDKKFTVKIPNRTECDSDVDLAIKYERDLIKFSIEQYYLDHKYCPNCKGINYGETEMAFIWDSSKPETYIDFNKIQCKCGWNGIRHELVN